MPASPCNATWYVQHECRSALCGIVNFVFLAAMITIFDRIAADPLFHSHDTSLVDLQTARYTAELADGDARAAVLRQK